MAETSTGSCTMLKKDSTLPYFITVTKIFVTAMINIKEHFRQTKILNYLYTSLENSACYFVNVVIPPLITKVRDRMEFVTSKINPVRRISESLRIKRESNNLTSFDLLIENMLLFCKVMYQLITKYLNDLGLKTMMMDWIASAYRALGVEERESKEDESSETEDVDDLGNCEAADSNQKLYSDFLKGDLSKYPSDEDSDYVESENGSTDSLEYLSDEDTLDENVEDEDANKPLSDEEMVLGLSILNSKFNRIARKNAKKAAGGPEEADNEAAQAAFYLNEKNPLK